MHVTCTTPSLFLGLCSTFNEISRTNARDKLNDKLNGFGITGYEPPPEWRTALEAIEIVMTEFVDPTVWKDDKLKQLLAYYDMDA